MWLAILLICLASLGINFALLAKGRETIREVIREELKAFFEE